MTKFAILYIDDEETETRKFQWNFRQDFEVETLVVNGDTTLSEINTRLNQNNFDYLIVDYNLNEKTGCGFNGGEILEGFLNKYPHFPTMMLTSYEPSAFEEVKGIDVEKIRGKVEYAKPELKIAFTIRVGAKIAQYKDRVDAAEKTALELKEVSDERELSADEAQLYIDNDNFLQETLGAKVLQIPADVIYRDGGKLDQLLKETGELIEMIKKDAKIS